MAAQLLLWPWAIRGKAAERSNPSRYGILRILAVHVCAVAAMFSCINYKSPERRVAEQILDHMTIRWDHDGKSEYFNVYDESISHTIVDNWFSGRCYEGIPTSRYDQTCWTKDFSGKPFNLKYDNKGLHFFIDDQGYGRENRREFISYEKLFKSKEVELIASNKFFPVALPKTAEVKAGDKVQVSAVRTSASQVIGTFRGILPDTVALLYADRKEGDCYYVIEGQKFKIWLGDNGWCDVLSDTLIVAPKILEKEPGVRHASGTENSG
jgi:hypothetical protein